jgi:nucleoside-diphosphate-sugar epimerase
VRPARQILAFITIHNAVRVIIIGGTRFIGPHVVRGVEQRGYEVVVVHRGTGCDDARHIHRDRLDLPPDLHGDLVIDLWCMTEAHAKSAAQHFRDERYVVASSGDVYRNYDGLRGRLSFAADPVPLSEDSPLRESHFPYRDVLPDPLFQEYDKILVERALAGDRTTVLRLPAVYGPGDEQHRFVDWIAAIDRNEAIPMSQLRATWRWTHGFVENVADAILLAAFDDRAAGRTYSVGDPDAPTQEEWVQLLGGRIEIVDADPGPPLDYEYELFTDTTRIREELGYSERVPREAALERTRRR